MPGIADINTSHEQMVKDRPKGLGFELRLKDGDIAVVSIVPSGKSGDSRLDRFFTHSIQRQGNRGTIFAQILCQKKTPSFENGTCVKCDEGGMASERFGMWVYAHYSLHPTVPSDKISDWKEIISKSGKKMYQEDLNSFLMFSQGFGRQSYLWKQLINIFDEHGALNVTKVRIRRDGSGRDNTSYSITSISGDAADLPESDKYKKLIELAPVIEFFSKKEERDTVEGTPVSLDDDPGPKLIGDDKPGKESLF